jgi:hypothetical protein
MSYREIICTTCALLAACVTGCDAPEPPRPPPSAIAVPHAGSEITIDGETDEVAWQQAVRVGPLQRDGHEARPFSDARFLWRGDSLYFVLYAADQDLHATLRDHDAPLWLEDAFELTFGPRKDARYVIDISPAGVTSDARIDAIGVRDGTWESGVEVAMDADGTLNDPRDEDEEWVVEGRIPLARLGLVPGAPLAVSIRRWDTPVGGKRTSGESGPRDLFLLGAENNR